jgi:hypothetical protein
LAGSTHFSFITGGNHDFLDVALRRSEQLAFHALAIDEHRLAFRPTLYSRFEMKVLDPNAPPPRTLDQTEQRWFVGAHANVGGGVDNDLFAQIPLKWLLDKAMLHGLSFRGSIDVDIDFVHSPVEDSFAEFAGGAYKIVELGRPFYRVIGAHPEERPHSWLKTINETIDGSVFDYLRANDGYRPKNLADWAASRGVKPEDLHSGVNANDPKATV